MIKILNRLNNFTFYWWLIFVLAILVRLLFIDSHSLRLDEAQSIWQASHSLDFIRTYMLKNVHLPLHNSLLHIWLGYFGTSEASVRLMAAIPGILSIPVLYALAKEILGKNKALLAMSLAAISPLWVWYSREIRMYTLLILITTLSYLFYVLILKYGHLKHYIIYIIINIFGVYTHYFFSLVLLVQVVFFVIYFFNKTIIFSDKVSKKKQLIGLSASGLLVVGSLVPWLVMLYRSYGSGSLAPVLAEPTTFNIILSFFEFTFGFQPQFFSELVISVWPILILLGFIFLTKRHNPFSPLLLLVLIGTLLPVVLVFTVSILYKPVYLTRYLISITPFYLILITWYLTELTGFSKRFVMYVFIGLLVWALFIQETHPQNPALENYRDAVAYINSSVTPRDIVILAPPYTIYPFQYYYEGSAKVATMPIWIKKKGGIPAFSEERIANDAQTLQAHHKRMFLLLTTNLENSYKVKEHFDSNYTKLEKHQFSKDVWLEVYQAEY